MFDPSIYSRRRQALRAGLNQSWILIPGHDEAPCNYPANTYPFRQNSNFLYFAGHSIENMALLITPDDEILFGHRPTMDDIVWTGPLPSLEALGEAAGIKHVEDIGDLSGVLARLRGKSVPVHYLPPYRGEQVLKLGRLLGIPAEEVVRGASGELMRVVAELRLVKEDGEVAEIERALEASLAMYRAAAGAIRPGALEYDVMAAMSDAARRLGFTKSFIPIITIHGEVLHNHSYHHPLPAGGLILLDSGAESPEGYASDITRTFPVSGVFSGPQRDIYQVVLAAQLEAIRLVRPEVPFVDVHLAAARVIAAGLKDLGLMAGDTDEAVAAGAHALFFPHGLGHMLGLDVHDMEDLGDVVGYGGEGLRSRQFGLSALRMNRPLKPGYVFTIEPGVYFIPALIEKWRRERLHESFINYARVEEFLSLGGIRIEDDLLVTGQGGRVLGPPIPKRVDEVEALLAH